MTISPAAEALLLSPDHDPGSENRVASIVRRWHFGAHETPWRTCDLQPCDAVRREMRHANPGLGREDAPTDLAGDRHALALAAAAPSDDQPPTYLPAVRSDADPTTYTPKDDA